jgi:5'-3' exonuclease
LYSKLDEVLRVMQPRKTVMLAVDGPAPLAKLLTQRERRKVRGGGCKLPPRTCLAGPAARAAKPQLLSRRRCRRRRRRLAQATSAKAERDKKSGGGKRSTAISSTALTPGTPFLYDTCLALAYYVCNRLQAAKYKHLRFEVSGATVQVRGGRGRQAGAAACPAELHPRR